MNRQVNTRDEPRQYQDESSCDDIDKNTEFTNEQMTSLRSELFNINKRLNRRDQMSYNHSRQIFGMESFGSTDNAGATRPSTKGHMLGELDPIDHEK